MPQGTTLVLVDTEAHVLANNAIEQCLRQFPFDEVLVFTDRPLLWPRYRTVAIPVIRDIETYNRIILGDLPEHLHTDHAVVAQYDGFVLDGGAFLDDFRRCDYIGAVWPHFPVFRVGNGGFSWRSRRLVEAAAGMAHWRASQEPEDVFIARVARVALEMRHGCVFADDALASRFSSEFFAPQGPTFGFHGLMNLPLVYQDALPFLVEHLPARVVAGRSSLLALGLQRLPPALQAQFTALLAARRQALARPETVAA